MSLRSTNSASLSIWCTGHLISWKASLRLSALMSLTLTDRVARTIRRRRSVSHKSGEGFGLIYGCPRGAPMLATGSGKPMHQLKPVRLSPQIGPRSLAHLLVSNRSAEFVR